MSRTVRLGEQQAARSALYLTVPVFLTSVVLLVVGVAAAWYMHRLNREVSYLVADNLDCAIACERLVSGIRDARIELDRFLATGDPRHLDSAAAVRSSTIQALDNAERSAPDQQVRDMLGLTRHNHERFFSQFMILTTRGPADTLNEQVRTMSRRLDTELLAPAQEVLTYNQHALVRHGRRSRVVADRVGLGLLALGTCGAMAGLLSGFGMARNMTLRLEQSERESLRAEQLAAVGQLAAGLAHELRNPLTSMKLLIQTAIEGGEDASLDSCDLVVMQEEVERLEQLVKSFLDFARPPGLETTVFDVRDLVNQTLRLVAGPAARRAVTIDYEPGSRPLNLDADPVQIRQVLLNLLLNALDVSPTGGTIRVVTEALRDGALRWLTIRVVDSGPGIPEDLRERIFEPFVSTKETGTGLGLSICTRIVEAHGGTIDAENAASGGAILTVRLPVRSAVATRLAEQSTGPK